MTTANKITMVRVAMIPVFLVLCLWPFSHHYLASVIVFAIASITDFIDGYIARKYNQVTTFGKFVDPLADKLLVISAGAAVTASRMAPERLSAVSMSMVGRPGAVMSSSSRVFSPSVTITLSAA